MVGTNFPIEITGDDKLLLRTIEMRVSRCNNVCHISVIPNRMIESTYRSKGPCMLVGRGGVGTKD